MSFAYVLIAILGLAVLMVVHEGGHYLAARRFGMRVTKFSIGFGPTLWKHRPKGSPTTFQIAIIPFLAYVQIAGMNPYEDSDPKDPESYSNASLWARIVTIAAGPLANYFFASVLMFFGFLLGGNYVVDELSMKVHVLPNGPRCAVGHRRRRPHPQHQRRCGEGLGHAEEADRRPSEREARHRDRARQGRAKETLHYFATPAPDGEGKGKIQVGPEGRVEPVSVGQAAILSVKGPPKVVYELVKGLAG